MAAGSTGIRIVDAEADIAARALRESRLLDDPEIVEAIRAEFVDAVARATRRAYHQARGIAPVRPITPRRRALLRRAEELARGYQGTPA